jgi:ATPase subunit of ABC transporter with duplicated ATPase domains
MAFLNAHDVSFELPNGRLLFQHLSVSFESRVTALVGPNGVGKSCFARILAGELEPSSGRVIRRGRVAYFAQNEAPPAGSAAASLSGGQWMRVRLSRVLNDDDADFLILDEPTNDLDRDGRAMVGEFLSAFSGGVLLISHDRELLSICDDVIEFSNRGIARYGLGWNDYVAEKERERAGLARELEVARHARDHSREERRSALDRQEKRNRAGARAGGRGGLPKILLGARKRRAQSTSGRIDASTLERADSAVSAAFEAYREMKVDPVMYAGLLAREVPSNTLIAEAHGFNVAYDGEPSRGFVFAGDLDFVWRGPIRLAIRGANGSGKSTLLRALLGESSMQSFAEIRGTFVRSSLPVLYVDQRCSVLDGSLSVLENLSESSLSETEKRNGLAKFLFTGDRVFQKVRDLSGGERLRAALAKGFLSGVAPGLLILDEPTNNLDLANIEFLENLLRQFKGALIVVSHDEVFLENAGLTDTFAL